MEDRDEGLQDRGTELNTQEYDEGAGVTADANSRESIISRYRDFEVAELKKQGFDDGEIKLMLDGEDEEEKPDGKADEGEKERDEDLSDDEEKKPEGEDEPDPKGKKPGEDEQPDRRELTEADVLTVKVKVKVDGQESEVPVSELQKSYQIQGHLTRQLQHAAAMRSQLEAAAADLEKRKAEIEQEYVDFEARMFTDEEIAQRKRDRETKAKEKKEEFANHFLHCRNVLYQRHPDADNLDYDPDFNNFRQKHAPFLNEQLLQQYGPGVFFPAFDMVLQHYKDVKVMWEALQQAQNATTSFKQDRVKELEKRKMEQRTQKKKADDVKPSTRGEVVPDDDDDATDDSKNREYVRSMIRKRQAAQGL